MSSCASHRPAHAWPDASALPAHANLPNPLLHWDGSEVQSPQQWEQRRRPELKKLFQHYMYGFLPPTPRRTQFHNHGVFANALQGKASLKLVEIQTGDGKAPRIQLMMLVPNQRRGPVPVFLAMNFCGNHAVLADPRIPLNPGWFYNSCKGCADGRSTEASRGSQSADWPVDEIISSGYALATFCTNDIDADRKDVSDGVYAWLAEEWRDAKIAEPANRGTIAAWAWGFHRCVDYLTRDPDIDGSRIAAVGHSRNGKTALLAAAMDERIALAIPHQAGCGGTAPSRGQIGESVERINTAFPHWFNAEFKKFNKDTARLPFDQHCLVALCAPRPVLMSNAQEDEWANPRGQFDMLVAADPVYRFIGVNGLDTMTLPPLGELSGGRLGYYIRAGKHSMTAGDWKVFIQFANKHLSKGGGF
ncbi:MAG: acetylxylan esterase [Verrucomicrobia bacterium]|nr:acetylxylan esterase [Verrucomicrobiota bacterium]